MSDTDRYADIYLNFQNDQQQLADLFASMTHAEYVGFVDYFFKELDLAVEANDSAEFRRVSVLIIAIARKDLEMAHFMAGLTDQQREASLKAATSSYELARGFFPADFLPALEAAWAADLDHAARFGWPSIIFDSTEPYRVFKPVESAD